MDLRTLIDCNNLIKLRRESLKERLIFECELEMIERLKVAIELLQSALLTTCISEKERILSKHYSVMKYGVDSINPKPASDSVVGKSR